MREITLFALEKANRIQLSLTERESVTAFFARLDGGMAALDAVDTTGAEPMVYVDTGAAELREDAVCESVSHESVLAASPYVKDGFWQVPHILE